MLSSPRKPSSTIRILSSAEKCRRVARRMSFTTCSAGFLALEDLGFILVPSSADETKTLLNSQPQIWDTGADGEHCRVGLIVATCHSACSGGLRGLAGRRGVRTRAKGRLSRMEAVTDL